MIKKILKKQYSFICKVKYLYVFLLLGVLFILGLILNHITPHRYFYVNQLTLIFMLVIQIYIIKRLDNACKKINSNLRESCEPELVSLFSVKSLSITTAKITFILQISFVITYIGAMFILHCLESTITGAYGALLGAIVFLTGILAYVKYVSLAYFAYDMRNVAVHNYFFYIPSLTSWLRNLATLFSFIEKWFLTLGVLYTLIYALNMPESIIQINNGINVYSSNNFIFYLTSSGIVIFFVLAFPFMTFFTRNCIKFEISVLKNKSIHEIEKRIRLLLLNNEENNFDSIEKYLNFIKTIKESPNYPLESRHALFDSLYSIFLSIITLVSSLLPIIENLAIKN